MSLLAFALLVTLPWAKPPEPPPEGVQLVLTQPDYPFPVPDQLVIDLDSPRELPFNARTTSEKFSTRPLPSGDPVPTDGLAALRISGSGQFCQNQFWALQETLTPDRQVTVIDLRAEPHGFLNNMAVSWGPRNALPAEPATTLERRWLAAAAATRRATATAFALDGYTNSAAWEPIDLRINVRETSTEEQFVRRVTWGYRRFHVTDFTTPPDAVIDDFITFIKSRDASTWLHLHCDTGLGRTTTFMTLVDMMANSGRASAAALIERQHRLGGSDLADTSDPNPTRAAGKRARLEFLKNFYRYCRQSAPTFRQSWSSWKKADARANRFHPTPGTPTQPPPAQPPKEPKPVKRR
jgi:hypothetical protein